MAEEIKKKGNSSLAEMMRSANSGSAFNVDRNTALLFHCAFNNYNGPKLEPADPEGSLKLKIKKTLWHIHVSVIISVII